MNIFLAENLPDEDVTIIDIGASKPTTSENKLLKVAKHPNVKTIGFEANKDLCAERQKNASENEQFYPYFIADGQTRPFYEMQNPQTSSLYEPNIELLTKFQDLYREQTVNVIEVETTKLDDVGIEDADLIKLDIQGAELLALQGGRELYKKATLIDVEVEFLPIYKDQPLFSDVDIELRENDFHLMRFNDIFSRQLQPCVFSNDIHHSGAVQLWAYSAYYMRNLLSLKALPTNKLIKMAFLIDAVWNQKDVPMHILYMLDQREGTKYLQGYMDAIYAG